MLLNYVKSNDLYRLNFLLYDIELKRDSKILWFHKMYDNPC